MGEEEAVKNSEIYEAREGNIVFRAQSAELSKAALELHLEATKEWVAGELTENSVPIPERLTNCLKDITSGLVSDLNGKGVKEAAPPPHIFLYESGTHPNAVGGSDWEYKVAFADKLDPSIKSKFPEGKRDEMEEVWLALVFAEEISHAMGGRVFNVDMENEKPGFLDKLRGRKGRKVAVPKLVKSGLVYPQKIVKGSVVALEEGLVDFATSIIAEREILKHYDEEVVTFVSRMHQRQSVYPHSGELTKFLAKRIPGFLSLAQRARVDNDEGPLKEAIESKFGNGSFDKVIAATEKNAAEVKKTLEETL